MKRKPVTKYTPKKRLFVPHRFEKMCEFRGVRVLLYSDQFRIRYVGSVCMGSSLFLSKADYAMHFLFTCKFQICLEGVYATRP